VPFATADDGIRIAYEETGSGFPLLFIHEFAGDSRSWESQVRYFCRRYRCLTYNARGYPPSDVPDDPNAYSQERAVADAVAVLDHLPIERAHVIGLSMGGFCALHLGLGHPERVASMVVAGCGYGAQPELRESFRADSEATASAFESEGSAIVGARYAVGPARVQLQNKDPRGWAEFAARLGEHSVTGLAHTQRGVSVPTLVLTGDEDEGALDPSLMLKRTIPSAALLVLPRTGHACNLEEPDLFNRAVQDFIVTVDSGRWEMRDPRSLSSSLTGMRS
jgi:pimeloyl-ACP methyl ester carboxylesterase